MEKFLKQENSTGDYLPKYPVKKFYQTKYNQLATFYRYCWTWFLHIYISLSNSHGLGRFYQSLLLYDGIVMYT